MPNDNILALSANLHWQPHADFTHDNPPMDVVFKTVQRAIDYAFQNLSEAELQTVKILYDHQTLDFTNEEDREWARSRVSEDV